MLMIGDRFCSFLINSYAPFLLPFYSAVFTLPAASLLCPSPPHSLMSSLSQYSPAADTKNVGYSLVLSTFFCYVVIGHWRARGATYIIILMWPSSRAFHTAWWTVVAKNRLMWEHLLDMRWSFTGWLSVRMVTAAFSNFRIQSVI